MKKRIVFLMSMIFTFVSMTEAKNKKYKKATFGAGCFWGVEDIYMQVDGVVKTTVGYLGGEYKNPSYKDVCTGRTGHAEVVEIIFNSEIVSYDQLLDLFWRMHDPTTFNRQGPDVGTQYRSAIFYHNEIQKKLAEKSRMEISTSGKWKNPIVTEISLASKFYKAEEYHQEYFKKNGLPSCHIVR
jgi:peptide-methionine (S)-S-oxide reductase